MNWLDLAVATPTIGVHCEPRLQFPHEMVTALRPVLEKWKETHPKLLVFIPGQGSLITIKRGDGFNCDLLGNAFTATFLYESKVVDPPGALATIKNPPIQKFSALLLQVTDCAVRLCESLSSPPVLLTRLGVVADCRLDGESLPPGLTKFIAHIGKPWGVRPTLVSGTTTVIIGQDDKWVYRCHHTIDLNSEDKPRDVRLKLDWQMSPTKGSRLVAKGSASQLISEACVEANKYFESFGGGGLDYALS